MIAFAAAEGLGDRSLREIAAATGTSHRMLLYHFGSRAGLVAAIVAVVEAQQRTLLAALAADAATPRELAERHWRELTRSEALPFARLFFELLALVARDAPSGTDARLALTDPWLAGVADAARTLDVPFDATEARLGVAVVRGLLLDLVSGAPAAEVDRAYTRFLDRMLPDAG